MIIVGVLYARSLFDHLASHVLDTQTSLKKDIRNLGEDCSLLRTQLNRAKSELEELKKEKEEKKIKPVASKK